MPSSIVFIVPALGLKPRNASVRVSAPGRASESAAARQSDGTTSKPAPGRTAMPAAFASASRANTASKTSTSPVMSRYAVFARRHASSAGALVFENGPAARSIARVRLEEARRGRGVVEREAEAVESPRRRERLDASRRRPATTGLRPSRSATSTMSFPV